MITRCARLVAALLLPLALLAGCGGDGDKKATVEDGPCKYLKTGVTPAKKVALPSSTPDEDEPTALTITTNVGDIPITLEPEQAPCAVNNFVSLAAQGYFDETPCHRLTTDGYYVLQCGDPTGTGTGGPGYTFADELVTDDSRLQPCGVTGGRTYCTYGPGIVAMANSGPDTNGSQFFLVYGNSQFPADYTVLGHFDAAGLKVVKGIAEKGVGTLSGMGSGDGAPKTPVTIRSVK